MTRYAVVNYDETFGGTYEFDNLDEARAFCDSERIKIGGTVHIHPMRELAPGAWVVCEFDIIKHTTVGNMEMSSVLPEA